MKTINVLPIEEIKYVKTISFDVDLFGKQYYAKIVYKRNLSENYTMDDSKRSEIDRMMYYYPEECYPSDIIDQIIINGVKEKFPSAKVSTRLMLCDVERENIINELSRYAKEDFFINIQPRIDDINEIIKSGKKQWRVFEKTLPLYITNSKDTELFKYMGSFIHYDLDKEQVLIGIEPQLLGEVTTF